MTQSSKSESGSRPIFTAGFNPHLLRLASLESNLLSYADRESGVHDFSDESSAGVVRDLGHAKAPNRLRQYDRLFATVDGCDDTIVWLEVVGLFEAGYRLKMLSDPGPSHILDMSFDGDCVLNQQHLRLQGVDTGHRYAPAQHRDAVANYKAFRGLGLHTTLEAFGEMEKPSTNLVFFNSHRHAIAALCLGQYFVAGGEIWVVTETFSFGFAGCRLIDDLYSNFSHSGKSLCLESVVVEAAIKSEGDFDYDGWMFEARTQCRAGFTGTPLFALSPNLLKDFMPGNLVLMTSGKGLSRKTWEILGVSDGYALLRSGPKLSAMNMATGVAVGAAEGHHFAAIAYKSAWLHGDPPTMFKNIILYA